MNHSIDLDALLETIRNLPDPEMSPGFLAPRLVSFAGTGASTAMYSAELLKAAAMVRTLGLIQAVLDGKTWTADTAGFIADALIDLGLEIRGPCECDCNDRSWYGQQHDSACPLAGLDRE